MLALFVSGACGDPASGDDGDSDGDGESTGEDPPPNLIVNGSFDDGTASWTAMDAQLSVEAGQLRVETTEGGPGLAWQEVDVDVGQSYTFTVEFGDATYTGSSHVRIGSDVNLDEMGAMFPDDDPLQFTATESTVVVTCNNVAAMPGEFALFDDLVLSPE